MKKLYVIKLTGFKQCVETIWERRKTAPEDMQLKFCKIMPMTTDNSDDDNRNNNLSDDAKIFHTVITQSGD